MTTAGDDRRQGSERAADGREQDSDRGDAGQRLREENAPTS